ncbi:MAG: 2OG-Fe dioxygenase family protein [Pseudomonadota bacterium]|nr:2OG-Fe dioxygenase family protein [Pseudomonadota bacterium]
MNTLARAPTAPLTSTAAELPAQLRTAGWAVLDATTLLQIAGLQPADMQAWTALWSQLPADPHLRDGGRYRRRRHGCFVATEHGDSVVLVPHRAHWQPLEYNALHGGFERWFDPLPETLAADPAWLSLLGGLARVASGLRGRQAWSIEAHPFRIDTTDGIGRPTPEGAHRDGVDLVVVMLVARHNIKGGETRVFEADGPHGVRFTLTEPFSALLLDDARVVHESTPIQPVDPEVHGWRDTLVLTFRSGGFQGPETPS